MEKSPIQKYFLHKIFICEPIFKNLVALFRTFGMQNGDTLKVFFRSFRKVRFRKMQSLKDGVQTVGLLSYLIFTESKKRVRKPSLALSKFHGTYINTCNS